MAQTTSNEVQAIRDRYERRSRVPDSKKQPPFNTFQHFQISEREFWYGRYLSRYFPELHKLQVFELGAGTGGNLSFFRRLGIMPANLWANELMPDRMEYLKAWIPEKQIFIGDAMALDFPERFDVVFQS